MYFIQSLHIGAESDYKHTVIYGPPGTGKTEIAKIIGRMYSNMGILKRERSKGFAKRSGRRYLGQTAIKQSRSSPTVWGVSSSTRCILCPRPIKNQDIFSKECIDILCEALSEHRDDLMVVRGTKRR
jgi:hypothetical protein